MHELERVKKKYDLLKYERDRTNIDQLRLRADLAEAIRDAKKAGATRSQLAELLELSPSRITQLEQGNVPTHPPAGRRLSPAPEWAPEVQAVMTRYLLRHLPQIEDEVMGEAEEPTEVQRVFGCKYCGSKAMYEIALGDGRHHYVCKQHAPEGVK